MKQPNILYFVCHDLGRHLGCYGLPVATPHIDAFAADATRFDQAYCNSPACSPSRCCAMTGQYAHSSGGIGLAHMGWPLPHEVRTIVDEFNDNGYETIHAGMEHERHPGENHYQVDMQEDWDDFHTAVAVDKALAYLEQRCDTRPFYLNIGSQQPHPSTWKHAETLHGGAVPSHDVYIPPYLPDNEALRADFGRFQAAIRYMDTHFGRLWEGIRKLGLDNNTVVVFTTDHGISAPRSKGTLYDRGTEIALLVRHPGGLGGGARHSHLIQNIDFVPTLLDAAGIAHSRAYPGKSFWPLLTGEAYEPHEVLFMERNFHGEYLLPNQPGDYIDRYDPIRSVRTADYHLIRYYDPSVKFRTPLPWEYQNANGDSATLLSLPPITQPLRPLEELFHTRHDPQEFVDVADRPEFRHILMGLRERLGQWMERTDDFVLQGDVPQRREKPGWGSWNDKIG